jgi:hypothetical protein
MRTYTVTQREGELLGPIDWSHDFARAFDSYCTSDERKADMLVRAIENLWQVERLHLKGVLLQVREGDYWHDLLAIGMYDGWPYWKPMPAVLIRGPLGGEWRHFPCVDEFRVRAGGEEPKR